MPFVPALAGRKEAAETAAWGQTAHLPYPSMGLPCSGGDSGKTSEPHGKTNPFLDALSTNLEWPYDQGLNDYGRTRAAAVVSVPLERRAMGSRSSVPKS